MNTHSRLYDLLPAYVRFQDQQRRDPEMGIAPLEALIRALEASFDAIEENIGTLYDGWFIETCEDWRIPYIADLLGVRGLEDIGALIPSQRTRVANTIAYRRRKGTPAVLGQAARDNTGWPCHIKVFRDFLAITQAVSSPRLDRGRWVDLRQRQALARLRTPFDPVARTVDLRSGPPRVAAEASGGYHPYRLGLTFWRLSSYPMRQLQARPSRRDPGHFYRCHPAAVDSPLFNPPRTPTGTPRDPTRYLPLRVNRGLLRAELSAARLPAGERPTVRIQVQDSPSAALATVPNSRIAVGDLSTWQVPKAELMIDPENGRLAFAEPNPERIVKVDCCFGMAADLGGGPYPRPSVRGPVEPQTWQAIIDRAQLSDDLPERQQVERFSSLRQAIDAWRAAGKPAAALLRIHDSDLHPIGDIALELPKDCQLTLRAEERCWPLLVGKLEISGDAGSRLRLDGLVLEGKVQLGDKVSLEIEHCTLKRDSRAADQPTSDLSDTVLERPRDGVDTRVSIRHSRILGELRLSAELNHLEIADSVLGSVGGVAISGPDQTYGPATTLERCTLLGTVKLHQLLAATNTLFTAAVKIERWRDGQIHFCYLPHGSRVPPRQQSMDGPPLITGSAHTSPSGAVSASAFISLTYGHPAFAQLSLQCGGIDRGGEQGNEIGAFHGQRLGNRLANLNAALDEFLPSGFTARIAFAT